MLDDDTLPRARRFAILMSLAVIAFYGLRVSISSGANYVGFTLTLGRADLAVVGLWAVWLWAQFRFAQRVYERLSVELDEIFDDVRAEEIRLVLRRAKKYARQMVARKDVEIAASLVRVTDVAFDRKWDLPPDVIPMGPKKPVSVTVGMSGERRYSEIYARWKGIRDGVWVYDTFNFSMETSLKDVRRTRALAWLWASVALPAVSGQLVVVALFVLAAFSPLIFPAVESHVPAEMHWG